MNSNVHTFRTVVEPLRHQGLITHERPGLMVGSCFTDNIGSRLTQDLFNLTINPFGTLYNPASIAQAIDRLATGEPYETADLVSHEGRWHSMHHHSSFSADTPEACLKSINEALAESHDRFKDTRWCVVTLGSAWVWVRHGEIVANCHKLSSSEFQRIMLSVDDAEECLTHIMASLPQETTVIFTVSPIRHKGDGAHGNQLSKSTLLLAIDRIVASNPDRAIYFPSFEIMIDDLRDYRFYAADMRHPSETAIDYIYSLFKDSFFSESTTALAQECHRLWQRLAHRPLTAAGTRQARLQRLSAIELARKMALDHPELQDPIARMISNY